MYLMISSKLLWVIFIKISESKLIQIFILYVSLLSIKAPIISQISIGFWYSFCQNKSVSISEYFSENFFKKLEIN